MARLLRSEDGQVRAAAAGALQALTRRRQLDLTSIAAELASLVSERGQVELASELLVRWAMGQRPPDWETVDHFCLHPIEAARTGALRAISWDWTQGEGTSGTTTRLARALMDETTAIRQQAHSALAEGRRLQKPFLSVEPDVLEALVAVLGTEPGAGVAEFLLEYARSAPQHAAALLPALQAAPPANRVAIGLAATCQQIAGGVHVGPCTICRYLGQEAGWGEEMVSGGLATTPPPPSFARLERLNETQYRCPECGAYFALHQGGGSFMNAEWTSWTLTRAVGPETRSPSLQTHEYIRRGDFGGLDRTLLRSPDPAVQMEALETIETQVREGLDIAVLEPTLRELLTGAAEVALAAARALTRSLLRRRQPGAVEALLSGGGFQVQLGALNAIDRAALESPAEVGPYLAMVRRFFESDEEALQSSALAIVLKAGLEPGVAEATAADATRRLESPRPQERALAASILSEAARQRRADIRPALPRLAALWRNENASRSAQYAAERAIKHAGGELEHLGGITGLVERLRDRRSADDEVATLRQMLERGEDISPAFEALATKAGSWPLELLKRAAFQGDDLTPALAPLRLLTRKADQDPANIFAACEGRAAVGILACHCFFRKSWADLTAILGSDQEYVRVGLREAVGEIAGLVWGKHPAQGARRRGAAAALAYLALGTDRSDLVSLAFDLELPEDVMGGVVEGLAAAARSGMNVERFLGRLRKLRNQPLVAELVAAVKPEPLRPVERTEWHSGRDHCQVTDTEVVCWSGEGHGEVGASCSLKAFLDGEQQDLVQSLLGGAVLREVLNAVRSQVASAPKAPGRPQAPASRPRRKRR